MPKTTKNTYPLSRIILAIRHEGILTGPANRVSPVVVLIRTGSIRLFYHIF